MMDKNQRRNGMQRIALGGFAGLLCLTACSVPAPQPLASSAPLACEPANVLAMMEHVADWQLAHPARYRTTDWTQGALYAGMMALDGISPSPRFREAMQRVGATNQWKLGAWHYNADDHCVGQMYAEMAMRLEDSTIIGPMRAQFDSILEKPSPVALLDFRRREAGDRWSWCDALFMAPPAWTRLWSATGDRRYLDYAVSNWWITSEFLYDDVEHLFYRDSTYFNRIEANGKRVFWGRGNGWVMGGLVRVIQDLPADHPERERFLRQFRDMSAKILQCQQPDGLWRSSLLDPESYPLKETSGSGFNTYAVAWGVNEGVLDRARFQPAVDKAWAALVGCVTGEGKLTHVQPIGADPKKFDVNHSDVYGVGAFLLAGSEVYRMHGGRVLYTHRANAKISHDGNAAASNTAAAAQFQRVVERYRQVILRNDPDWSQEKTTAAQPTQSAKWIESLGADGTWPDIDYANQERAFWKTCMHLDRVRSLARALVDPQHSLHQHPELESAVFRALDFWLAKRFTNPNWWWNQIGVPAIMADVVVLMDEHLSEPQRKGALEVVAQSGRPRRGSGANTVWIADISLQYAALTRNAEFLAECSRIIAGEINITTQDGIQSDYSFHQHYQRLQQFSYGRPYLVTGTRVAWQLQGTPWEIAEEKAGILAGLALEGDQWMSRGIYTVPSVLDRSVSRPGTLKWADIRTTLKQLRDLVPQRSVELNRYVARQNDVRREPLVGARNFPRSDFVAYHRPRFSFFVKTLSSRTFTTEVGLNSEHLKGGLQNCGDHYLMREGDEYFDLAPVWDWNRLPGVTYAEGAGVPQRDDFVGAVTDQASCAIAMNTRFGTTNETRLSARKFWACHGDIVVSLVAGLKADASIGAVRTAMDQSHLRGPVTLCDSNGRVREVQGSAEGTNARWIHHAGFVYVPIAENASVETGVREGSWRSINAALPDDRVSAPVFLPSIEHDTRASSKGSGFVIAPGTAAEARKLFKNPPWRVLRNDEAVQAVQFDDGAILAAIYQANEIVSDLRVDRACLVLQRGNRIWIADPAQRGGWVTATIKGKTRRGVLRPGGFTAELLEPPTRSLTAVEVSTLPSRSTFRRFGSAAIRSRLAE